MMTIEDYALDVDKTIEEVEALCKKAGIAYIDEKTVLDETAIILLDNEIESASANNEEDDEIALEEEVIDKAEELARNTKFDIENSTNFEKVKSKAVKKAEPPKKDILKERKKLYKHREKLQSNEQEQDANTVLYKEYNVSISN